MKPALKQRNGKAGAVWAEKGARGASKMARLPRTLIGPLKKTDAAAPAIAADTAVYARMLCRAVRTLGMQPNLHQA